MKSKSNLNPENPCQALLFYDLRGAPSGTHPREVVKSLADTLGFKVVKSVPQTMMEGIEFWIEFEKYPSELPRYIIKKAWKPVGQV